MRRNLLAVALALATLDAAAAVNGYVLDPEGKPIAGARVRAVAIETTEAQFERYLSANPEPVALATAESDSKGAFRLDTKRQPVVALLIDAPGRMPLREEVVDGDTAAFILRPTQLKKGRVTANGKPVPNALVIAHNLHLRTDEKGEYSVPPNPMRIYVVHPDFAIADIVRMRDTLSLDVSLEPGKSVTGRVVDAGGKPVANAVVRSGNWPVAKSAEDGSFTVAHVDAKSANALHAVIDDRIGVIKGDTIVVRPAGTVAGTVRNAKDDLPVAGLKVTAQVMTNPPVFATAITDAKGAFLLKAIPPGVRLVLSHPAFMSDSFDANAVEGRQVERSLTASPYGRLAGTVTDDDKRPLGGASIQMSSGGRTVTVTAPDGTFAMRMPPAPIRLMVTKPSYPAVMHGPVRLASGEVKSGVRIVVPRGKTFELVLIDTSGVPVANEPVVISRRAEDEERYSPIWVRCSEEGEAPASCRTSADGKVSFAVAEGLYDIRAGGETTVMKELRAQNLAADTPPMTIELERGALVEGRVVWSDGTPVTVLAHVGGTDASGATTLVNNGTFTMRNVPAGKISLVARTGPPTFVESEPVDVTAPMSGVVLTLPRLGRVEGRVIERGSQRPVRQFTVVTERRGSMRRGSAMKAFTAEDGRFVLEDVAPGAQDVVVTAPGFVRATSSNVEVPEGKAATVEVTLERGGTVVGRVTSGGRPVSGAQVTAAGDRGRRPDNKQTDANGDYLIDTLAAGPHDLVVRKEGYLARTITVNVSAGKETRGDVELSRGRELTGRVVDTSGRPIAGAEISYNAAGTTGGRTYYATMQQSDAEGNFRIEGLADEPYTVYARKSGYVEATTEITASTPSVTLTLSRGGTLNGRVSGLAPADLSNVEVSIASRGGARTTVVPDATGAFTLTGVPDGEVDVTAIIYRPRHRAVQAEVNVVGGTGPFVELDFASGLLVRGRVLMRGRPVRGTVHLASAGDGRGGAAMAQIQNDGTYEARVAAPGQYRFLVSMNDTGTIEIETIDVRGDMEHDVEVRGGPLRVRVIDAATGSPVPAAVVSLVPADRGRSISSGNRNVDSSGWATFDFASEARYTVRAQREGYAPAVQIVTVENLRGAEVELSLGRAELVLVTVVDEESGAPAEAFISILDNAGQPLNARPPQRDAGGAYRLWLGPGNYTLNVMGRLYEPAKVSLTVPGTPTVLVKLPRKKG